MSTNILLQIVCLACGAPFAIEKPARGRYQRFCSPACRRDRHLALAKGYRAEGRYGPRTTPAKRRPVAKVCVVCEQPFETINSATVCCGLKCGFELSHRRSAATRTARRIERDARVCQHCGADFVARNSSGRARRGLTREGQFCSRRCAASARQGRRVEGHTEGGK